MNTGQIIYKKGRFTIVKNQQSTGILKKTGPVLY